MKQFFFEIIASTSLPRLEGYVLSRFLIRQLRTQVSSP